MPKDLGKIDSNLTKMTKDEIKEIHSKHKRELQGKEALVKKSDFEINRESDESDEDFVGPSLDLF